MSDSPKSPEELLRIESELLAKVAQARTEYDHAKVQAKQLLESAKDAGMNNFDGTSAMAKASRIQQAATTRYMEALRSLTDFVINKKLPRV